MSFRNLRRARQLFEAGAICFVLIYYTWKLLRGCLHVLCRNTRRKMSVVFPGTCRRRIRSTVEKNRKHWKREQHTVAFLKGIIEKKLGDKASQPSHLKNGAIGTIIEGPIIFSHRWDTHSHRPGNSLGAPLYAALQPISTNFRECTTIFCAWSLIHTSSEFICDKHSAIQIHQKYMRKVLNRMQVVNPNLRRVHTSAMKGNGKFQREKGILGKG